MYNFTKIRAKVVDDIELFLKRNNKKLEQAKTAHKSIR